MKLLSSQPAGRWFPTGLRARLLALTVVAAVPIVIAMSVMAVKMRSAAVQEHGRGLSLVLREIAREHERLRVAAYQTLRTLSRIPAVVGNDPSACVDALESVLEEEGVFYDFGVIDLDGKVRCSGRRAEGVVDVGKDPYFQRARTLRVFTAGHYQVNELARRPAMSFALPTLGEQGQVQAVIYAILPLSTLFQPIPESAIPPDAQITLVDPEFRVLVRSPPDLLIGKSIAGTVLRDALASNTGNIVTQFLPGIASDSDRFYAFRSINEGSDPIGFALLSVPASQVVAVANKALRYGLLLLALIIAAFAAIMYFSSNALVLNRVDGLLRASRSIAAGNLSARAQASGDNNEFSTLERAFNDMADKNEAAIAKITHLSRIHALLTAISSAIVRIRNTTQLAKEACRIAVELGGYTSASIFLVDHDSKQARAAAHVGPGRDHYESVVIDIDRPSQEGDGPLRRTLRTATQVVETADPENGGKKAMSRVLKREFAHGARSLAAFPLSVDERFLGALQLHASHPHAFDGDELPLLVQLSTDIALGLELIDKELRITHLSRVHTMLSRINAAIVRVHDQQVLLTEACRIAVEEGKFGMAWISKLDPVTLDVTPAAWAGPMASEHVQAAKSTARRDVPQGHGVVGRAIREKKPIVCNDLLAEPNVGSPRRAEAIRCGFRSLIGLPLIVEGAVWGALTLYADQPNFFTADEERLLTELAADISFALDHLSKADKLNYLAFHDALTGTANRSLFEDRLSQAIARARQKQRVIGVLAVRLERLRQITDAHGRAAADHTLQHVARYFEQSVRPGDTVARIGDDEFGILLVDAASVDDVVIKADRLLTAFPSRVSWSGLEMVNNVNIGIATYPLDGEEAEIVVHNAEIALNNVTRRQGNAFAFYSRALDERANERLLMETQLSRALPRAEFSLVYQPVIRVADRSVVGAEALLRWSNGLLGKVSPALFVPIAEQTGLIGPIGHWVFETACAQRRAWTGADAAFRLAVNVSAAQLRRTEFLGEIARSLEQHNLAPHELPLSMELTETALIEHIDQVLPHLRALKALGILLEIDDFGTGYSSLSYLRRLPVDTLKIDISFVRDVVTDPNAHALANSIVALGHSMGLHIVAEGVETEAQLQALAAMGCDYAQGYLFSRPVAATEFEKLFLTPTAKRS